MLVLALASCDGCGNDRPTVPTWGSASVGASARPTASAPLDSGSAFAPVDATAAPAASAVFELGGKEVRARSGRVFKSALTFDADGDGADDLVALTEQTDGRKLEVALFRGGDAGGEINLVGCPKDLDLDRCSRQARLSRIEASLVVLDVEAKCGEGRTEQWVAVVRLDAARSKATPRPPELRLELRAAPNLQLSLAVTDKDSDGHPDLIATAKLRGAGAGGDPSATLVLSDRPAGFALDPAEPQASLEAEAKKLAARAKTTDVREQAARLIALARAVCADFGDPMLKTSAGTPRCGDGELAADAIVASGLSLVRSGDLGRAATLLDALAALPKAGARKTTLEAALDAAAKPVDAGVARRVSARPTAKKGVLAPFAWTTATELQLITDSGVVAVDVASGEEAASDAIAWPRGVAWRSGDASIEVIEASTSCDPPERRLYVTARQTKAHAVLPSALDMVPRRADKGCKSASLPLSAITVGSDGATAAVGAELYRLTFGEKGIVATPAASALGGSALSPPGASRSADGKAVALPLADALLVVTAAGAERWRGADLKGLGPCAPSPDGARVACVSGGQVVVVSKK